MPTINVPGVPASRKTPGFYFSVLLGGAATSSIDVPRKVLILANKITSNLTAASPSYTVVAGTLATATPTQIGSADDALTYAGQGSEAHRMAMRVFEQYPDADVTLCLVAESGGVRASAVYTFATTATAAFTVRFRLNGKTIDVAVASGDTATVIATNCATAILNQPDLPVTAQFSVGALTITAKHPGPRGNDLVTSAAFVNSSGVETNITTGSTTSPGATTGILSGVTTVESTYFLSNGTTADDCTSALAALTSRTYHRYVSAARDATQLDLIVGQMNAMAIATSQMRQQAVAGSPASSGTATTLATGRNAAREQIVWHYNSPVSAEEVAAQVCAARLAGDSVSGGTLIGEADDPGANLDGLLLHGILPQPYAAEQPTPTEIENALNNGLTPLAPASGGRTSVVRSVTSRSLANSQPNYSVLDTTVPTVLDFVADDLQTDLATFFHGYKLAPDNTDGSPPRAPSVTTPNLIRDRIKFKLKQYEGDMAIVQNVDAHDSLLKVVLSATPGRVDCEIPVESIAGLHILAGNVRQVSL
jgi:phage tail sheath gpL-like